MRFEKAFVVKRFSVPNHALYADEAVIVCEASLDDICIEPGINRDGMAVLAPPLQAHSR